MSLFADILVHLGLAALPSQDRPPPPPPTFLVRMASIADEKPVFATIESANVVPARVRTGGTIIALRVRQGDHVARGQQIATIGDQKLKLEIGAFGAQVDSARARLDQARQDYERARRLVESGAIARNMFDQARTAFDVAQGNLKSTIAQRAMVQQQEAEGAVQAPASGRVIAVPVTAGTVVMAGDVVATVAEENFVLRLQVPERHARSLRVGGAIRLDGADFGLTGPRAGAIRLIYPQVDKGLVVADAQVRGLGDYFVGQRVRVWITAGERPALVVPQNLISTRSGIDYARLWSAHDGAIEVPVQRGQALARPGHPAEMEILSGLRPGDRLLKP